MAATMATSIAILNTKCFHTNTKCNNSSNPTKQISLLSIHNLSKGLTGIAVAGVVFSSLSTASPAFTAQQPTEIADGDSRGLALLLPWIPAVAWVFFNIFQPTLNQINKIRRTNGIIIGLGLGGLAAAGFFHSPEAVAVSSH